MLKTAGVVEVTERYYKRECAGIIAIQRMLEGDAACMRSNGVLRGSKKCFV